ncbi:MAG TPA: archease [Syntrophobacteria bacterium]|nr:archease [Syntrophobacteria bacterium]
MAPGSYELIDHTADVGIRVMAASPDALFETAALALTELMTDTTKVEPRLERTVKLRGESLDLLLVCWLQEILFLMDTEGLVFSVFEVRIEGAALHATLRGEPFNPEVHPRKSEVKAVTYHHLEVATHNDRWEARVILDI